MRKEAGFEVTDRIVLSAGGNSRIKEIMEKNAEMIRASVLANAVNYGEAEGYVKEWNLNGETVSLGVRKDI